MDPTLHNRTQGSDRVVEDIDGATGSRPQLPPPLDEAINRYQKDFYRYCIALFKKDKLNSALEGYLHLRFVNARKHIPETKLQVLQDGRCNTQSIALKIYNIFEYTSNMMQFDLESKEKYETTENESFARCQYIFRALLRGSPIQVRTYWRGSIRGNKAEMDASGIGGPIDMPISTTANTGVQKMMEVSTIEHKKADAKLDTYFNSRTKT
ncbi:hypothetical protein BJV82DRAFT_662619 [Fennellomyces sp. T-0311]|nr:hypothetical protein BJV82DRAFT_662619 [Fennellomyces sp. T-0311]